MPKINSTNTYPQDDSLDLRDFVIGSDFSTGVTKTYNLGSIKGIFGTSYTREEMFAITANPSTPLYVGVWYKITDAISGTKTVYIRAVTTTEFHSLAIDPSDPANFYSYDIGTSGNNDDSLDAWVPSGDAVQGVQGVQGTVGVGTQGTTGAQGAAGEGSGEGVQGATGTQGTQGIIGSNGTQGATGIQGAVGTQGVQGRQGTTGVGTQGANGTQGASGTNGTSGTQGTVGTQGTTGAGDMDKATYDTDGDGTVNNSELLEGQNGAHYLDRANHSGTQDATSITGTKTASFISDFAASVLATVLTGLSTASATVVSAADTILVAIGKLQAQISGKQDTLVSATNIKTVNGNSLLGAGDLAVSGGGSPAGSANQLQFNNGSAFAADSLLVWDNANDRLGVGIAAPVYKFDFVQDNNAGVTSIANTESRTAFFGRDLGSGNRAGLIVGCQSAGLGFIQGRYNAAAYAIVVQPYGGEVIVGNPTGFVVAEVLAVRGGFRSRGAGTTNAANALIVEDSAGTVRFYVKNNGETGFGSTSNHASAQVQIDSTTKGFLPPRMTTAQKNAIATPLAGLMVYDTDTNKLCCYNGSTWNDLF